jgi:biotin transport system substrate-specific component
VTALPRHRATRARELAAAALFAGVTAVSALVAIPNPFVPGVPFTLQVLAVLLSGITLGAGLGFTSQVVYLLLGAVGLPVYAGGHAGFGYLFSLTGGFLMAFPLAAAAAGAVAGRGPSFARAAAGSLAGLAVIYALGWLGMHAFGGVPLSLKTALSLLTFLPWDAVKAALAAEVGRRLQAARAVRHWAET